MTATKPALDVSQDEWKIILGILQAHIPQHTVWAFGSRATNRAKPYSDLDLAIIGTTPLSLETHAALADAFSESDLPWKVDLVDWAATSEDFRNIISRDKIVLQQAGQKA